MSSREQTSTNSWYSYIYLNLRAI
eukprot:SAG31_NODE_2301_length_5978_cov_14.073652_1_plen_23_part_10